MPTPEKAYQEVERNENDVDADAIDIMPSTPEQEIEEQTCYPSDVYKEMIGVESRYPLVNQIIALGSVLYNSSWNIQQTQTKPFEYRAFELDIFTKVVSGHSFLNVEMSRRMLEGMYKKALPKDVDEYECVLSNAHNKLIEHVSQHAENQADLVYFFPKEIAQIVHGYLTDFTELLWLVDGKAQQNFFSALNAYASAKEISNESTTASVIQVLSRGPGFFSKTTGRPASEPEMSTPTAITQNRSATAKDTGDAEEVTPTPTPNG